MGSFRYGFYENRIRSICCTQETIGQYVLVNTGPPLIPAFKRSKIEVVVVAKSFEDFGGITADGAHIGRNAISKGTSLCGYTEDRTGRITVEIYYQATTHLQSAKLAAVLAPNVLSELSALKSVATGQSSDKLVSFSSCDFQTYCHNTEYELVQKSKSYNQCKITYFLDGILQINLLKNS